MFKKKWENILHSYELYIIHSLPYKMDDDKQTPTELFKKDVNKINRRVLGLPIKNWAEATTRKWTQYKRIENFLSWYIRKVEKIHPPGKRKGIFSMYY